jgi:hypothetical protein
MRSTHTTYHSLVDTFIAFGDEYTLRRSCAVFTNWNKEWQKNYTHVKIIDCVCVCVCVYVCETNGANWIEGKGDCKGCSVLNLIKCTFRGLADAWR